MNKVIENDGIENDKSTPTKVLYSRCRAVLIVLVVAVAGLSIARGVYFVGAVLEAVAVIVTMAAAILVLTLWVATTLEDGHKK